MQHGKLVQQDRDNECREHAEQCNRACEKHQVILEMCKDDSIEGNFQGINRSERKLRIRNFKFWTDGMTGKEKPCLGVMVHGYFPPIL